MAQKPFKPAAPVKATITATPPKTQPKPVDQKPVNFIFDRGNYQLLVISIAVVAFGFILMSGTTDIYSTTKIVIAPIVVLSGFALGFFAIFKKSAVKS